MSLIDLIAKLASDGSVTVVALVALVVVYEALRIIRNKDRDQ